LLKTRRIPKVFSIQNPITAHDASKFCEDKEKEIFNFFSNSISNTSRMRRTPNGLRAVSLPSYSELEEERYTALSKYRFIAKTDISRFYHSIYTHSIPWALHGKEASKADRRAQSAKVPFNRLDQIMQFGQDGQTIGIPVGSDTSRITAELISTAIDLELIIYR
jgi:hypothetical protein